MSSLQAGRVLNSSSIVHMPSILLRPGRAMIGYENVTKRQTTSLHKAIVDESDYAVNTLPSHKNYVEAYTKSALTRVIQE